MTALPDIIVFHPLASLILAVLALAALPHPKRAIALLILSPFLPFLLMRWIGVQLILVSEWATANRCWARLLERAVDWLDIPQQYK